MMIRKILFSTAALLAASSAANAQVLINEFNSEGSEEFVELYNAGGASVNLADYALIVVNGSDNLLYGAAALSGSIAAGDYFVVSTASATINGETPDLVLTSGSFQGDALQNGPDGIALINGITGVDFGVEFQIDDDYSDELAANTAVQVDAVIYDDTPTPEADPEIEAEFGLSAGKVILSEIAAGQSVQRVTDGQGGANNSWATSDWALQSITVGALNQNIISPVVDVANIAAALAESNGTEVRITGTVTVVSPIINALANRNAFYIQDASGADGQSAIVIDDPSGNITTTFATGDTIVNIQGTMSEFGGTRQFAVTTDASSAGTVTPPAPLTLTGSVTDINDVLSELIRINGVTIAETGTFAADTNYTFLTPTGLVATIMRVEDASTLVGQTIPGGTFDVIGIAGQFGGNGQIFPRTAADVFASTSVSTWDEYSH